MLTLKKYDSNARLFFGDTDSLMLETKTKDVHKDFSSHKVMFDFSYNSTK